MGDAGPQTPILVQGSQDTADIRRDENCPLREVNILVTGYGVRLDWSVISHVEDYPGQTTYLHLSRPSNHSRRIRLSSSRPPCQRISFLHTKRRMLVRIRLSLPINPSVRRMAFHTG